MGASSRARLPYAVRRTIWNARRGVRRAMLRFVVSPGRRSAVEGRREELAARFLHGDGIEIGALNRPLWTPPGARVRYVDMMSRDELMRVAGATYHSLHDVVETDVVDDGRTLERFADASLDFVIANHVLEHCEDPVAVLGNWLRVLRPGGIVFLTLPDARHTFDAPRERTTPEHLLRDHAEGPAASREEHLREYVRLAERLPEQEVGRRVAELAEAQWPIHFHVWELDGFLRFLLALDLPARIEVAQEAEPEFTVLLRRT